jgi:hypothetical protein
MTNYTPRQKRLIRERFFRWVVNSSTGKRLDWKRAANTLKEVTGIWIDDETLRQNFNPVSAKKRKPPREFTDPSRYTALHGFLTSDMIGYLTDSELKTEPPPQAVLAILMN